MEFSHFPIRRIVTARYKARLVIIMMVVILLILYAVRPRNKISVIDFILSKKYIIQQGTRTTKSSPVIHNIVEDKNLEFQEWNPYMDIIEENVILKDKQLIDIKRGLSFGLSKVFLKGNSKVFHIGDEVRIGITALDGYGKVRKRGGDQFRVRIFEKELNASASGYVVDHQNGTYTAVVRALWPGRPIISIVNGFPREIVRAWYYTLNKVSAITQYLAKYGVNISSKMKILEGICHPILDRITHISEQFCNRTRQNGGASLYCHRPEPAVCKNFIGYSLNSYQKRQTFTKAELKLSERYGDVIQSLQVSVKGRQLDSARPNLPMCEQYNVSNLWLMQSPVGFFFRSSWKTIHCRGISETSIENCVRNKHFIFVGDSTLRQWFKYISTRFNCTLKTQENMYKTCHSCAYNMSAEFSFHSIPGHYIVEEPTIHSIHQFIDTYKFSPTHILVFHMQSHLSTYHPRVFRERMLQIRRSIDNKLTKYYNLRIYLKGPHTFKDRYERFSDYFGYVYRTIMLEIFEGLYDKIVYLDSKDMTIATAQIDNHPTAEVVRGMVNQFLSYVCEDRTINELLGLES